jgi:hypothetical protein
MSAGRSNVLAAAWIASKDVVVGLAAFAEGKERLFTVDADVSIINSKLDHHSAEKEFGVCESQ